MSDDVTKQPAALRTNKRTLLLGVGFAVLVAFVFGRVAARGRFTGEYSTYGSGPEGTRALFLLADSLGARPERYSQDLAGLPSGAMLVAFGGCEARLAREVSRYENEELERWVDGGGVLLVAGAREYLSDKLGVTLPLGDCGARFSFWGKKHKHADDDSPELPIDLPVAGSGGEGGDDDADSDEDEDSDEDDAEDAGVAVAGNGPRDAGAGAEVAAKNAGDGGPLMSVSPPPPAAPPPAVPPAPITKPSESESSKSHEETRWAVPTAPALRGLSIVPMRDPARIRFKDDKLEHEVLLSSLVEDDPKLRELGVVVPHGKGKIIVLASASLFQNRALRESDGALVFTRILHQYAPHARVLFDEYHVGVGERRSVMLYLRQAGVMPAVLGLFACLMVWLLRAGARFGAVRKPPAAPPRGTASFVAAMGRLYSGARDPAATLDAIARRALARIALHHHVPNGPAVNLQRSLLERNATTAAKAVDEIEVARTRPVIDQNKLPALVAQIDAALARALA